MKSYFTIRGGSLKKIAKKIIPNVPTNKKVYTNASIKKFLDRNYDKKLLLFVKISAN